MPTCNLGWYTSGASCIENDCTEFTSATSSITGCSSFSSCLSGTKTTYKCDSCYTGYDVVNGVCSKTCTYTATAKPSNCATATGSCQRGSASGTKTYYSSSCSTCNYGWTVSSGSCVENTCTGFTSTSSTIAHCASTSSCKKGNTTLYKCDTCASGFEPDGSGGCKSSCSYTNTSTSGCSAYDSCVKEDGWSYFYCIACKDGYEINYGKCSYINTCTTCKDIQGLREDSSYTLEECKSYGSYYPISCQKGVTLYYGCERSGPCGGIE